MNIKTTQINVKGFTITIINFEGENYISLTDMARNKNFKEPKDVVKNWMRTRSTIEFLALWEQLSNPDFKGVEIDPLLYEAGIEPWERLVKLNQMAISQLKVLIKNAQLKKLK